MSHLNPGPLGAYNSLTDKHLESYFNNVRIQRHLQRVGLISRSGRIVPEKEYRYRLIQRAQQKHVRECLAQAVFYRVLEMERLHQTEIKRKLEDFARRERVHKIKLERSNRYEEEPVMILSPRPPSRPKNGHTRHSRPEAEPSDSTDSLGSSRPNTAPGKMQRPVRLKPLNSTSTPGLMKRNSSRYRSQESSNDTDQLCSSTVRECTPHRGPLMHTQDSNKPDQGCQMEKDVLRHLTLTDFSSNMSPYRLPIINYYVTPVPPLAKRKENGQKVSGTLRGRRLRPSTTPSDATDPQDVGVQRVFSHAGAVLVKMVYFGKSVHLSHDLIEVKDEVKVFQQHCGGENLCVYKGKLKERQSFQFFSRRHRGFPFSLTFFLNGLQVERLSSCCEFKHRKSSRLGGRHAHFGFSGVEGAAPCYRCIITMGLDKKPSPPKRVKEEPSASKGVESKPESSQSQEADTKEGLTQEDKPNADYEEEFEADDEGPMDDEVDDGNDVSPSPSGEVEQDIRADLKDRNQDTDSEAGHPDKKRSSSMSSGLSSSSSSEEEESSEEEKEEENHERCSPGLSSENDTKAQEQNQEPPGIAEKEQNQEPPGTAAQEKNQEPPETTVQEEKQEPPGIATQEENQEPPGTTAQEDQEKAESVQEKLAKAFLNFTDCTSEPELSDTTTEEEEQKSDLRHQTDPGAEPEDEAAQQAKGESSEKPPEPEEQSDDKEQFKTEIPEPETKLEKATKQETKKELGGVKENEDDYLQTQEDQEEAEMQEEPSDELPNSETDNQEEEKGEANKDAVDNEDEGGNPQSEIPDEHTKTECLGDNMSQIIKMQKLEVPEETGSRGVEGEVNDDGAADGSGEWSDNTEEIKDGSTEEDEVEGEPAMDGSKNQDGGRVECEDEAQSGTVPLDQEEGTNQERVQTSVTLDENTVEKGGEREAEYPSENNDETNPEQNEHKKEEEENTDDNANKMEQEQKQDEDSNTLNREDLGFSAEVTRVEFEAENGEMAPSADQEVTNQPDLQEQETPDKEDQQEEDAIQTETQHDVYEKDMTSMKETDDNEKEDDHILILNQEAPNEKEDGQAVQKHPDEPMGRTKSTIEKGVQDENATEHENEEVQQDPSKKEGENDEKMDRDHEEPEAKPSEKVLKVTTEEENTEIQQDTVNNDQQQEEQEQGDGDDDDDDDDDYDDDDDEKSNQTPEENQDTINEEDEEENVKLEEINEEFINDNGKEVEKEHSVTETEANQMQEIKQEMTEDEEGSNNDQTTQQEAINEENEEPNQTQINDKPISESANDEQPEIHQDAVNEDIDTEQECGEDEKEPNHTSEINRDTTDQEDARENNKQYINVKSQHEQEVNKETNNKNECAADEQPEIQQDEQEEMKAPNQMQEVIEETISKNEGANDEQPESQRETFSKNQLDEQEVVNQDTTKQDINSAGQQDEELINIDEGEEKEDANQIEMQQDISNKPQQNEQNEKEEAHGILEVNQEPINEENGANNDWAETQQDTINEDQQNEANQTAEEKEETIDANQSEMPGETHNNQQDEHKPELNPKTINRTEGANNEQKDSVHENEESFPLEDSKAPTEENMEPEPELKDVDIGVETNDKQELRDGDGLGFTVDQSADAAEEVSNDLEEGSIALSEESQSIEKVLALKRDDSVASEDGELIVTPHTHHGDLVSNWVNVHQASRYFETCIESLDDMENGTTDMQESQDKNFKTETEVLESDWSNGATPMSSKKQEEATEPVFAIQVQEDVGVDNVLSVSLTSVMKYEIS